MADNPFAVPPGRSRVPRFKQDAEDAEDVAGVPAGAASVPGSPTDKKTGIGFFKGKPASTPVQNAKKKALIDKLRSSSARATPDLNDEEDV